MKYHEWGKISTRTPDQTGSSASALNVIFPYIPHQRR